MNCFLARSIAIEMAVSRLSTTFRNDRVDVANIASSRSGAATKVSISTDGSTARLLLKAIEDITTSVYVLLRNIADGRSGIAGITGELLPSNTGSRGSLLSSSSLWSVSASLASFTFISTESLRPRGFLLSIKIFLCTKRTLDGRSSLKKALSSSVMDSLRSLCSFLALSRSSNAPWGTMALCSRSPIDGRLFILVSSWAISSESYRIPLFRRYPPSTRCFTLCSSSAAAG